MENTEKKDEKKITRNSRNNASRRCLVADMNGINKIHVSRERERERRNRKTIHIHYQNLCIGIYFEDERGLTLLYSPEQIRDANPVGRWDTFDDSMADDKWRE